MCVARIIVVTSIYLVTLTWPHIPLCAAYQYFILGKNGDYKYGYRTDDGMVVRQEADSANQVSGHYFYRGDLGNFGLKYTSGVQGYSPQNLDPNDLTVGYPYPQGVKQTEYFQAPSAIPRPEPAANKPYQPLFNTGNMGSDFYSRTRNQYGRSEGFDFPFNSIWYYQTNLKYPLFLTPYYLIDLPNYFGYWPYFNGTNRSYNFSFDTGNYKKNELCDSTGNVRGYFEYGDNAGRHDLSYTSNRETGFQVNGGNLVADFSSRNDNNQPSVGSNYGNFNRNRQSGKIDFPFSDMEGDSHNPHVMTNLRIHLQDLSRYLNTLLYSFYDLPYSDRSDRTYYFLFDTGRYKIEEASNRNGDIRGYFQYADTEGYHDLRYIVGDKTGFQVIGGNLAVDVSRDLFTFTSTKTTQEFDSSTRGGGASDLPPLLPESNNKENNEDEIIFLVGNTTERPEDVN